MKALAAGAWLGLMAAAAGQSAPATAASASRVFASPAGYTVRYPKAWTSIAGSPDRLLILSPGHRVQGPVIGPDQAAILIRPLDAGERIPTSAVPVTLPNGAAGQCHGWLEQDASDDSGPGPVSLDRSFYCRSERRTVLVQLTHWADDRRHAAYRRTALAIASSLRLRAPAPSRAPQP